MRIVSGVEALVRRRRRRLGHLLCRQRPSRKPTQGEHSALLLVSLFILLLDAMSCPESDRDSQHQNVITVAPSPSANFHARKAHQPSQSDHTIQGLIFMLLICRAWNVRFAPIMRPQFQGARDERKRSSWPVAISSGQDPSSTILLSSPKRARSGTWCCCAHETFGSLVAIRNALIVAGSTRPNVFRNAGE